LVPGVKLLACEMGDRILCDEGNLAEKMKGAMDIYYNDPKGYSCMRANAGLWANSWDWDKLYEEYWRPFLADVQRDIDRAPRQMWHRGGALVFEHNGRMRKQDSRLCSPASKKELALYETLSHPNIIPILDSGVDPIDDTTWFEMPKYTPLREMAELSEEQADKILAGVESALRYLHKGGVAHRDVCPENVVVDDEGNPYLVDFEWACHCDGDPCVDFEPWAVMDRAAPQMQRGGTERGFHTIVRHLKGQEAADLLRESSSSGLAKEGVPYQPVEGLGPSERECSDRWQSLGLDVKGKRFLDIGCNAGWFVRKALEEGAEQAIGVDSDVAIIKLAKTLGDGDYYTMPADAVNGQLGTFDIVLLLSVLQHIEKPEEVLATAKEISKEVYVEIPHRFITPALQEELEGAKSIGESERGRPIFKVCA
ncbi:MAG: methyltransferase domain-containing protein, partial [Dehalococcoidia bacterium]